MTSQPTTTATCEQCGCRSTDCADAGEWGPLCTTCAFRQAGRDDARDSFAHLSARTFGFCYEDE